MNAKLKLDQIRLLVYLAFCEKKEISGFPNTMNLLKNQASGLSLNHSLILRLTTRCVSSLMPVICIGESPSLKFQDKFWILHMQNKPMNHLPFLCGSFDKIQRWLSEVTREKWSFAPDLNYSRIKGWGVYWKNFASRSTPFWQRVVRKLLFVELVARVLVRGEK